MSETDAASTHHVSASQIETYRLCPRKWAFNKLDGIKAPPNKYAQRGTDIHNVGEAWLDKGKQPDLSTEAGKIFMPGMKFLPPPHTGVVENEFRITTDAAMYLGKWDLWEPEHGLVNGVFFTRVLDHKSTSDFKWIKTPELLRKDPQANIYGVAALKTAALKGQYVEGFFDPVRGPWRELDPEKIGVVEDWVYYLANSNKPAARKVRLVVLPDGMDPPERPKDVREEHFGFMYQSELSDRFDEIEDTSAEMLAWRSKGAAAMDVPFNLQGCAAFGGCPYRGNPCKLTLGQRMKGHDMQNQKVADMIKAKKEAALAAANGVDVPAGSIAPKPQIKKLSAVKPSSEVQKEVGSAVAAAQSEVNKNQEASTDAAQPGTQTLQTGAPQQDLPAVNPLEEGKAQPRAKRTAQPPVATELRDLFAVQIAAALIVRWHDPDIEVSAASNVGSIIAATSYSIADELIKARGK